MDKLPQEIIDRIVFFLAGDPDHWNGFPRTEYAVVDRRFRHAIEHSTFRNLTIGHEEIELFAQSLIPGRRPFLRNLYFSMILPPMNPSTIDQFELPSENEFFSRLFSHEVTKLLETLRQLDGVGDMQLWFLHISHYSGPPKRAHNVEFRCHRSPLKLLRPEYLPQVSGVLHLSFQEMTGRSPRAGYQIDIAACMEGLRALDLFIFSGAEVRYPGFLRNDRRSLADALEARAEELKGVSDVNLDMGIGLHVMIQTIPMPNLTYPEGYDILSSALRVWSQGLTRFRVSGVVDESLFWPHALETDAPDPEWDNMEVFEAHLELHTASGWWHFMPRDRPNYGTRPRNPAEDPHDQPPPSTDELYDHNEGPGSNESASAADNDENENPLGLEDEKWWNLFDPTFYEDEDMHTRHVPNEDTVQPLFAAWAKALQRMSSLRKAVLRFRVNLGDLDDQRWVPWGVVYDAPHSMGNAWDQDLTAQEQSSRRLSFLNLGDWQLQKDILDSLKQVGSVSHPLTEMVTLAVDEHERIVR